MNSRGCTKLALRFVVQKFVLWARGLAWVRRYELAHDTETESRYPALTFAQNIITPSAVLLRRLKKEVSSPYVLLPTGEHFGFLSLCSCCGT